MQSESNTVSHGHSISDVAYMDSEREHAGVMDKPVTLRDLSRLAGVSITTVSRALHGKPDIGESTRARINSIAKELGYQPNVLARSLRLQKSKVLGILVSDNTNPYYAQLLKGIEETARRQRYTVILSNTNDREKIEEQSLSILLELRIAGLLAVPVNAKNYCSIRVPLIFLARHGGVVPSNYVVNDDEKGGYLAVRHLVQRGYRRIAFVNGPRQSSAAIGRLGGYRRALSEAGADLDRSLVMFGNTTMEDGYTACKKLLRKAESPLAVFCYSDYVAIGVIRAVREAGLEIPRNVAIVGYDDVEVASLLDVPLTTVRQPIQSMGARATELLIDMIKHPGSQGQKIELILEPELVVRKSS